MNESKIKQINSNKKNKNNALKNDVYKYVLYGITLLIVLIILFSIFFVLINGINTITNYNMSISELFFGNKFTPSTGVVALGFIVVNTLWMAFLSTLIAAPISIGTALIITRILNKKIAAIMFSIVAILAAIPSVVYGSFGYYVLDKFFNHLLGFDQASLFTIVIMIAFMITPTITIMTIASIRLTDVKLENSSYALGATKTQTSIFITLRSAKVGIFTGILFGVGRCLGESTAISMVGSPSSVLNGITLPLWKQSLFLAPALLQTTSGEIHGPIPLFPIMAMFLLLTTTLIFGLMKFYEFNRSEIQISKKQSKTINYENLINNKFNKFGVESLTKKEQNIFIKINKKNQFSEEENNIYSKLQIESKDVLLRSTISTTKKFEDYKKIKSSFYNFAIYFTSFIGILLLFGIIIFLFNGGFQYLNWNTLTFRGSYYSESSGYLYGLAVPMMGTLISIFISLLIALPFGTILGICLSTYINKEKKIGWFISFIFQMLTSIPTIIWSTIAIAIFEGTSLHENYITIEPIIFLSIIILPSIIKQTEEAGSRVNKNQVNGSYALGATTFITTKRIYLKEIMPSIISAALLAISIAMAESTIFISILPFGSPANDLNGWFNNGALTLSTTIYALRQKDATLYPETILQIKTIGIILMIFIMFISYTSTLVLNKKYLKALLLSISLTLVPFGFYLNNGSLLILIISLLLLIISLLIIPIFDLFNLNKEKMIRGNYAK